MEKYGYVPEENAGLDDVLDLFEGEGNMSQEEMRAKLKEDKNYEEYFSTTKQQQYLHIMFNKMGMDLRSFLEEHFKFQSTKLLYRTEASKLIDEYQWEYEIALKEQNRGGESF